MNHVRAFIANLILTLKDRLTTDTAELILKLRKLEAKIEQSIDKDERKLSRLKDAENAIVAAISAKNTNINAAYKLLHNVSELAK